MTNTNFILNDTVTPIKVTKYRKLLQQAGFDAEKTTYLVAGFQDGFDIGYRGPTQRQDLAANIPIIV